MKKLILTLALGTLLFSCKKEEPYCYIYIGNEGVEFNTEEKYTILKHNYVGANHENNFSYKEKVYWDSLGWTAPSIGSRHCFVKPQH